MDPNFVPVASAQNRRLFVRPLPMRHGDAKGQENEQQFSD